MNRVGPFVVVGLALSACSSRIEVFETRKTEQSISDQGDADKDPPQLLGEGYAISGGALHACAVVEGILSCWGSNASGQLGRDVGDVSTSPVELELQPVWSSVVAGDEHTCALTAAGEVYCWGSGEHGQLGQGDRESSKVPVLVNLPQPAKALGEGTHHACAILDNDELWCWGHNFEGQLGRADTYVDDQYTRDGLKPAQVGSGGWLQASGGNGHTCAVDDAGALWCWGRNSDRQSSKSDDIQFREPRRVGGRTDWQSIASGMQASCAIRNAGSLWCWGTNVDYANQGGGPLGLDQADAESPERVAQGTPWVQVATNTFHSCGITPEADLYCWGRNVEGQLGLGDTDSRPLPELAEQGVAMVGVGRFSTCVILSTGAVACTGKNEAGELGTGDGERRAKLESIIQK